MAADAIGGGRDMAGWLAFRRRPVVATAAVPVMPEWLKLAEFQVPVRWQSLHSAAVLICVADFRWLGRHCDRTCTKP